MKYLLLPSLFIIFSICSSCQQSPVQDAAAVKEGNALSSENDSLKRIIDSLNKSVEVYKEGYYEGLSEVTSNKYLFFDAYRENICGIATLQGYYLNKEKIEDDYGNKVKCDCFVVTSGPKYYTTNIISWIKKGYSPNFLNENKQPVINLDLSKRSEEEIKAIKKSTKAKPVQITIYNKLPTYSDVRACATSAEILKVFRKNQ
jgi:hypothetical protein